MARSLLTGYALYLTPLQAQPNQSGRFFNTNLKPKKEDKMLRIEYGYPPEEYGYRFTHAENGEQKVNFRFTPRLSQNPSWGYGILQTADLAWSLLFDVNQTHRRGIRLEEESTRIERFTLDHLAFCATLDKFVDVFMRNWQPEKDYKLHYKEVREWFNKEFRIMRLQIDDALASERIMSDRGIW